MMKRQRILRNASLTIAFMCVSLLLSPARADDSDESAGASSVSKADGASTISVSVSYTSVSNGGGGAATSTTATGAVAPLCDYSSAGTGAGLAHDIRRPPTHPGARVPKEMYPDWEQHENEPGQWYHLNCHKDRASSEEEYIKARDDAKSRPAVWVPDGEDLPAPEVDGETLAQAAWDAVDIPTPSIGTNPALGDSGATVVGLDTWVWADGDSDRHRLRTVIVGSRLHTPLLGFRHTMAARHGGGVQRLHHRIRPRLRPPGEPDHAAAHIGDLRRLLHRH